MSTTLLPDGMLNLGAPVSLPEVLDVLIVGGGPAGTAAAFRAKELGLSALVIDFDDLLKRIRDYAKDKPILPHFGGGDKMRFPQGKDLVNALHFDPIDKDDLCTHWKGLYRRFNVPAQIGVELTGLDREANGVWHVQGWNHRAKEEQTYLARHVVIGIGRGVPRRFDIPGNTDGIAYRLNDATQYVGAPAVVIGGGTSAAEAVIAISNAKAEHEDACRVYWSYRGTKMPKVSKALAEVFFNAYVGNGNIQYYPLSEPVAVITGPDKQEYLSLRVDRKEIDDRPNETAHLEFFRTQCVACIGEDIPEKFLAELGIHMVTGGPKSRKRMVVTPLLESQQPNVYLIGDLLSQAYLETDNFDADPETFREVKHRGNIKSALSDGVYVAEVIRQKIDGVQNVSVSLTFADERQEPEPPKPVLQASDSGVHTMIQEDGPPKESTPPERAVDEHPAFLVRMTHAGVDEDEFPLKAHGITSIGRADSDLAFPEDNVLSKHHASLSHGPDGFVLRDDGSEAGTYLRLHAGHDRPLHHGDLLRLGRQILVFELDGAQPAFAHYDHTGRLQKRHSIPEGTIVLGRQAPNVTLNPNDTILSRRHLALRRTGSTLTAKDLKSLNGTYLRVKDAVPLSDGNVFRVGSQIFRLEMREEEVSRESTVFRAVQYPPAQKAPSSPPQPEPEPAPAPSAAADGTPAVTFKGLNQRLEVKSGQTICDVAEQHGIDLNAECHAGMCGSDALRILSGREHLNDIGMDEADALENICELEPGPCRLACMARVTGPVVVEIVNA